VSEQDFTIRWYDIVIDEAEGRFVVCKLRRVSSPPVLVGSVSNSLESSFQRLVDIIRLGANRQRIAQFRRIVLRLLIAPRYVRSGREMRWG
jgi:hypothetical protein